MVISSLSSANTIKRNMDKQLQTGVRLFNTREFFECHEVLEAVWTLERGPSRLFLQSLIHIAVGFYHCQRRMVRKPDPFPSRKFLARQRARLAIIGLPPCPEFWILSVSC
jgi:hypothetical protein